MSVKEKKNVDSMIKEINEVYSNLITVITGQPYPSPTDGSLDKNNILINDRSLRIAIDKMSAVLKEAKLLSK
jgi:hypothetical protein